MIRTIIQVICDSCGRTLNDADDSFENSKSWFELNCWIKILSRVTLFGAPLREEHYCPECKVMAKLCQEGAKP